MKVQAKSVTGEIPLPRLQTASFLLYPHWAEKQGRRKGRKRGGTGEEEGNCD